MHNYTFDFELETMFTMLISALDDIIVKRFNANRTPEEQIKVRFVYAPKQRVLNDLLNKAQTIQLPVVAVSNGGIVRDQSRVFNKIMGSNINGSLDTRHRNRLLQPIPVDVTVNVSILARYQKDFDQIITNIFPYFDPYIVISWRTPSMQDEEIRSNVYWSGQITTTYPTDVDASKIARVQGDTTLTIKGWLFKSPAEDSNIFKINIDFNQTKELTTSYSLEHLLNSERVTIDAVPVPEIISPYRVPVNTNNETFYLYGHSFYNVTNVFLSGDTNFNTTFNSPFSSTAPCTVNTLSALYPGFTGTGLLSTAYTVHNDTVLSFTMPSASNTGFVDVIVQNGAGYGSLINNAQSPYLSGVKVF
jgi:hypothetical protein